MRSRCVGARRQLSLLGPAQPPDRVVVGPPAARALETRRSLLGFSVKNCRSSTPRSLPRELESGDGLAAPALIQLADTVPPGMADPTSPLPRASRSSRFGSTVRFPLTLQPLAVNRPVSIETVNRALGADRLVLLLLQENDAEDPAPEDVRHRHGRRSSARWRRPRRASTSSSKGWPASARTCSPAPARRCARRSRRCRRARAHDRGRRPHPPHSGADREGAVARRRPLRGAARRGHEHRGSAAPGLRAGDAARHEARRQAGHARGERPGEEAAGDRGAR